MFNELTDLNHIRTLYSKSADDSQCADMLNEMLRNVDLSEYPLLMAYYAASEAIKAKYIWNIFSKIQYLKQSASGFEKAVSLSPENIEIRFLRFTVQYHIPFFLGFSVNLEEDKQVICDHIAKSDTDTEMKKEIADFLIKSQKCDRTELEILKIYAKKL